jgi:hypothetical protein
MNRYILPAIVVVVLLVGWSLLVSWALTGVVVAQSRKAPCPPWCDSPVVKWRLTCVVPNSTEPVSAPADAQWVGIGGKLCYLVQAHPGRE